MNIFALHDDPQRAAQAHLDRHVVKMILEYAQLLSTAHRLLDGKETFVEGLDGKKRKFMLLGDERVELIEHVLPYYDEATGEQVSTYVVLKHEIVNPRCYNATHVNHPCAVWARENLANYGWLFRLFTACLDEYTHRYGKVHATARLAAFLSMPPTNIPYATERTPFAQAMPDEFKDADAATAYQNYYLGSKARMAKWTNRSAPTWFAARYKDFHASDFERPARVGRKSPQRA